MKPALLLVDLQYDFLNSLGLEPAAGVVVNQTAVLLGGCRKIALPVIHVWTTIRPDDDRRMPHWKRNNKWACVDGSHGHATPDTLRPIPGELTVHKTFFSAFSSESLDTLLASLGVDAVIMAGVHLHGCLRASAMDAYQRGFEVFIAEDAVASNDPLHAAITRRYLEHRVASFISVDAVLKLVSSRPQRQPRCDVTELPAALIGGAAESQAGGEFVVHKPPHYAPNSSWLVPVSNGSVVARAVSSAKRAYSKWRKTDNQGRTEVLRRFADALDAQAEYLARRIAIEIGKPISQARAEMARTVALLEATIRHAAGSDAKIKCGPNSASRNTPLGVVAVITPFNNPVAIPIGKIAPALLYGNAVVWKPAPAASSIALSVMQLLEESGCPSDVVNLLCGDRSTALALMADQSVDAVTFTGSVSAGYAAQEICSRRHVHLQGELGGNNAAIVWSDCDLRVATSAIAEAAFGFAGQRCTANRRVVVDARSYEEFLKEICQATAAIVWGNPLNELTQAGPLISDAARDRIAALVSRAASRNNEMFVPHEESRRSRLSQEGAYYPPTIICCDDPQDEIVQEESFGPLLVIQCALDWNQAIQLCNGVKHGLVAALFSQSDERRHAFLEDAQAGILKINAATADADAEAPFGGWKASGIGPPEHGRSDREFYTHTQAVYEGHARVAQRIT